METVAQEASSGQMIDILEIIHHQEARKIVELPSLLGVDMSITMPILTMLVATLLAGLFFYVGSRRKELAPKGFHVIVEGVVLFVKESFVLDMIGSKGLHWWPFLTALFTFILFNNLLGMIPGVSIATGSINVTATLAIIVFFSVHIQGVYNHGALKYLISFVPKGLPGYLVPFLFIIEIVLAFFKPFALAVRLFANMFAGHIVIMAFIGLILLYKSYIIAIFPLSLSTAIMALEIFFKILQAYIFTILTSVYLSDAIRGGH